MEAILKNDFVKSSDGKKRRFVDDLFFKTTGIDSKVKTANFNNLAENIQNGVNQEKMFLSTKISDCKKSLVSNFGTVIDSIKNNSFDNITYIIGSIY